MSEACTEGIYVQYARFGDRYLRKNVRRNDRTTYITVDDLPLADAAS